VTHEQHEQHKPHEHHEQPGQHQQHAGSLFQGVIIFILLAFLTLVEYFIAISSQSLFLLIVVALIKAGLVVYYYMHIYKLVEEEHEHDQHSYAWKLAGNRLGFWLFLLSDSFVFGGLLVTRFNLLGLTRPELNQFLGLIVTTVLLVSSFFMNRAETQMALGNKKAFLVSTALTFIMGLGFLFGVVFVEWPSAAAEGLTASSGAAGGVFYMMTGMHAFHVLTGLIFLLVIMRNGMRGLYTPEKHWAVEAATVYWHFIDVVWIFFYPALYLIGRLG
jgi:cytochrome c oxidase subunit 3